MGSLASKSTPTLPNTLLSAPDREHVLYDTFHSVTSTVELPDAVKAVFAKLDPQGRFHMSEPDKPIPPGAMGSDYPWLKLMFAALTNHYCIVAYERNGVAAFHYLAVMRLDDRQRVTAAWFALDGNHSIASLGDARKSISAGKLSFAPTTIPLPISASDLPRQPLEPTWSEAGSTTHRR